MFLGDRVDSERGKHFLIVDKSLPLPMLQSRAFRTIGYKCHPDFRMLDYRLNTESGTVEMGYKEVFKRHENGVELQKYRLESVPYLHGDPGMEKKGKIVADAPFMSLAHLLGAREIHAVKFESDSYRSYLEGQGVKCVLIEVDRPEPVAVAPEPVKETPKPSIVETAKEQFNRHKKKKKKKR